MTAVFNNQLTKLLGYLLSALTSRSQPVPPGHGPGTFLSSSFPILSPSEDFMKLSQVETKMLPVPLQAPSFALGLGPIPVLGPCSASAKAQPSPRCLPGPSQRWDGRASAKTREDVAPAGLGACGRAMKGPLWRQGGLRVISGSCPRKRWRSPASRLHFGK